MRLSRMLGAAGVIVAAAACKNKSPVEPKTGEPVVTTMTCDNGKGQSTACEIPLTNAGSFTVTLVSTSCEAHGNILALTKPTPSQLTADGCYEKLGNSWKFTGPFTGAATMALTVSSNFYARPPQLRATQDAPDRWTVVFEDGYDNDFNDMVFSVTTAP